MKDYQQLALIKDFVYEGKLPITVIGAPTLRDLNGLALSSRNTHLSNDEKLIASLLFKSLNLSKAANIFMQYDEGRYNDQSVRSVHVLSNMKHSSLAIC